MKRTESSLRQLRSVPRTAGSDRFLFIDVMQMQAEGAHPYDSGFRPNGRIEKEPASRKKSGHPHKIERLFTL
jgi:hypothetical protein